MRAGAELDRTRPPRSVYADRSAPSSASMITANGMIVGYELDDGLDHRGARVLRAAGRLRTARVLAPAMAVAQGSTTRIPIRSRRPLGSVVPLWYEKSMRLRVLSEFGAARLSDVRRLDVQDFVDGMLAAGLGRQRSRPPCTRFARSSAARWSAATWSRTVLGSGLAQPAGAPRALRLARRGRGPDRRGTRARPRDWATAFWAGLRHGELRALRVEDVDLATGVSASNAAGTVTKVRSTSSRTPVGARCRSSVPCATTCSITSRAPGAGVPT